MRWRDAWNSWDAFRPENRCKLNKKGRIVDGGGGRVRMNDQQEAVGYIVCCVCCKDPEMQ